MLEAIGDAAGSSLGEHPRRLVGADDASPARGNLGEVLAGAARRIEHEPAGRTRRQQPIDERDMDR